MNAIALAFAGLAGFIPMALLLFFVAILQQLAKDALSVVDALLSMAPEESKLPLVESRTQRLMMSLVKALGLFLVLGFGVYVLGWVAPIFISDILKLPIATVQFNGTHWMVLSLGASLPFFWLSTRKKHSAYSPLAQLFHHLILDSPNLGMRLFRREVKKWKRGHSLDDHAPFLIVTGLARAGTTSLLNGLQASGAFASLHYGYMPFLLSPGTWSRWYRPVNTMKKERSHGDGVQVGLASTEALEEYFFSAQADYVEAESLKEYNLSPKQVEQYAQYRALVLAVQGDKKTYLAKNNNAILRYASLSKQAPGMVMAVLFRHPLYHAASLAEMHLRFTALQTEDPFVLTYMDWLGHHEFGKHMKGFDFADGTQMAQGDPLKIDTWLHRWTGYYQRVLALHNHQMHIIEYDRFCTQPGAVIAALNSQLGNKTPAIAIVPHQNTRPTPEGADPIILAEALHVYGALKALQMPMEDGPYL